MNETWSAEASATGSARRRRAFPVGLAIVAGVMIAAQTILVVRATGGLSLGRVASQVLGGTGIGPDRLPPRAGRKPGPSTVPGGQIAASAMTSSGGRRAQASQSMSQGGRTHPA